MLCCHKLCPSLPFCHRLQPHCFRHSAAAICPKLEFSGWSPHMQCRLTSSRCCCKNSKDCPNKTKVETVNLLAEQKVQYFQHTVLNKDRPTGLHSVHRAVNSREISLHVHYFKVWDRLASSSSYRWVTVHHQSLHKDTLRRPCWGNKGLQKSGDR